MRARSRQKRDEEPALARAAGACPKPLLCRHRHNPIWSREAGCLCILIAGRTIRAVFGETRGCVHSGDDFHDVFRSPRVLLHLLLFRPGHRWHTAGEEVLLARALPTHDLRNIPPKAGDFVVSVAERFAWRRLKRPYTAPPLYRNLLPIFHLTAPNHFQSFFPVGTRNPIWTGGFRVVAGSRVLQVFTSRPAHEARRRVATRRSPDAKYEALQPLPRDAERREGVAPVTGVVRWG